MRRCKYFKHSRYQIGTIRSISLILSLGTGLGVGLMTGAGTGLNVDFAGNRENVADNSDTTASGNSVQSQVTTDYENAYKGSGVPDVLTEEVLKKYTRYLEPADDEYDFRYATDYQDLGLIKQYIARDSSAYEKKLGYKDVTQEQINKETLSMDSAACYLRYENKMSSMHIRLLP